MFVVFEGGDGAGKSTLIRGVCRYLETRSKPYVLTREPGGPQLCEEIREMLLHHQDKKNMSPLSETLLFLASRAQNIHEIIQPALEEGKIVLCDRFNASTIAYQGVGRGLGYEFVKNLCESVTAHCKPTLTFYLDLSPEIGLKRTRQVSSNWDRFQAEGLDFHGKVREGFLRQVEEDPDMHQVDGTMPPDAVLKAVLEILKNYE